MIRLVFCILSYVVVSLFFFFFPQLLHEKKILPMKCKHISHRGGAAENLENTMAAFQHAVECGTDMLELDIHITKDEQVVVSHDKYLARLCKKQVYLDQIDYKDIPRIEPPLKVTFAEEEWCHGDGKDRRIILLKEVFEAFPHMPMSIDLKVHDDKLIAKTDALIRKYGRENLTVWGSANDVVLQKLYAANPRVPTFFSKKRVLLTVLLYYCGLLPFIPIRESYFSVIMPSIIYTTKSKELFVTNNTYVRIMDMLLMRESLFSHLKRRGLQVYLWVLNEETDFNRAFRMGADGIITDHPTKLKNFLISKQLITR